MLRNGLVQNAAALYGMQFCRKIVPLIAIPYLARTLGPSGSGTVAFVASCAGFIILLVEFGFNLSATREIARYRDCRETCSRIVAGVVGTQVLLFLVGCTGALVASRWIPILRGSSLLLSAGIFYAAAQAFSPVWFLQGMERLRIVAGLDIAGKILGLGCVFLFVHSHQDAWKALAAQTMAPALASIVSLCVMYQAVTPTFPSLAMIRESVQRAWPLFVLRSGTSLYTVANTFVLGLVAPTQFVGFFAGAERIHIAFFGFLTPIQDALYPRLSHLAVRSQADAGRLARIGAVILCSLGLLLGGVVFAGAPLFVRVLLGPEYGQVVPALRIMSLILPFAALAVAGTQWLLPLGRDSEVNRVILCGGLLNIVLASILAPRFMHIGVACSVTISEAFVGTGMLLLAWRAFPILSSVLRSTSRRVQPTACLVQEDSV
jgi:polysaccharide transporter, PST family